MATPYVSHDRVPPIDWSALPDDPDVAPLIIAPTSPTLAEQVGALVTRWLAGPPAGEDAIAWHNAVRADAERLSSAAFWLDVEPERARIIDVLGLVAG